MTVLIIQQIGNEVCLFDGKTKLTTFTNRTIDYVKDWVKDNLKNTYTVVKE